MKRILICGLLVSMVILSACSGGARHDGKTGVTLKMDGNFPTEPERQGISKEALGPPFPPGTTYSLSLTVTAPDISPPLLFENPDYQLGSDWTVLVPNGDNRTFDLLMYVQDASTYNVFNIGFYSPDSLPAARTFKLDGTPLTVGIGMQPSLTAQVGTTILSVPPGKIYMDQGALGTTAVPQCGYTVQAYLIDPAFPGTKVGPVTLLMSAVIDGNYILKNVPADRPGLKIKIVRPSMGWRGVSDGFTATQTGNTINPVDITLTGWQPLHFSPPDVLVADTSLVLAPGIGGTVNSSPLGGWGNYVSPTYSSMLLGMGYASLFFPGNTVEYGPRSYLMQLYTQFYGEVLDDVTVTFNCAGQQDNAHLKAWRYKAPVVTSISDYCGVVPTSGYDVWIYGNYFDSPLGTPPQQSPEVLLDGNAVTVLSGSTTVLDVHLPAAKSGIHKLKVRNARSNSAFPGWPGFSAPAIDVLYTSTLPGC